MRPIFAHVRRHKGAYLLGTLSLLVVDAIDSIAAPWLQGAAFANLERGALARISFAQIGVAFAAAAVVQMALRYGWRHYFMKTAEAIGAEVRAELFAKLQRLPIAYYDRARTGDLASRMTNDLDAVRSSCGSGMLMLADTVIYILCVVPQLVLLSPRLALVTFAALPAVPILVYKVGGIVHARSAVVQDLLGTLSARVSESFAGIRVVQAFGQEGREAERFERLAKDYLRGQVALARVQSAFHPALGLVFDLALFLVLLAGGYEVVEGRLAVYELVVYTRALDKIVWPMMAVGIVTALFQRGAAAHARIDAVLEAADDPGLAAGATGDGPPLEGAVSIRGLTFRYPGVPAERPPALDDVSLDVRPGALVALTGPVGAGKSTLLALLARLYEAPPGTVHLDGRDIRDVPAATLRAGVAIVPQDTFLFSGTVEENVAFGRRRELGRAAIEEAARAARVDAEVRALPGGYEAVLGERGVNLSGGQRQRVAIARALVRAPRLLLLDDALSAVDVETEAAIAREVRDRRGAPTRIVATHRLSAIRAADQILVLDRGRVVERGTHDELMATNGLYARLARREALEEEVARA